MAGASPRRFYPVQAEAGRVIRSLVGLRPYRTSGFRVEAEKLDGKLVVHNYGHGGSGITLSWGSSALAVQQAWNPEEKEYAVLGCGVMGLSTARLLQERGAQVTIYTRDVPPHTTSNIAGGQWNPAFVADKRSPQFRTQFSQAMRLSNRAFQDYLGERYGVRWLENYWVSEQEPKSPVFEGGRDVRLFPPEESPFPGQWARQVQTMMVQTPLYLKELLDDVVRFGGRIVVRDFPDRESLMDLDEAILVNCTGLGSRELFRDEQLLPIRGQLTVLLPQPEIDYAYLAGPFYMFPRRDGVLLGGTHERGNWSLEADPATQEWMLAGHARLMKSMRQSLDVSFR